jgi:hypothetical protein
MTMAWPDPPSVRENDPQAELKKLLYQSQLEVVKGDHAAEIALAKATADAAIEDEKREATADLEREKADWANEYAQAQAANSAYLDVAKGALDRGSAKASFVQGAATAISGAYAGVLGLSFAIGEGRALPGRGILPAAFLGIAIVFAAAYVAFITRPEDVRVSPSIGTLPDKQRQRRNSFVRWAGAPMLRRRNLLQASVVSLGVGVGLLPLPYLSISRFLVVLAAIFGAIAVLAVILWPRDDPG